MRRELLVLPITGVEVVSYCNPLARLNGSHVLGPRQPLVSFTPRYLVDGRIFSGSSLVGGCVGVV